MKKISPVLLFVLIFVWCWMLLTVLVKSMLFPQSRYLFVMFNPYVLLVQCIVGWIPARYMYHMVEYLEK